MKKHPFQRFVDLIEFDQGINKITREIEAVQHEVTQLQHAIKHVEDGVLAAQHRVKSFQKMVDEQELEIKELAATEKDKKARLEEIGNYKEYQALKAELDQVQAYQIAAEKELTEAWKNLESSLKNLETLHETNAHKLKELQVTCAQKERALELLQHDLAEHLVKRPAMEKDVPAEWLDKYAVMRTRVSNPVVPVVRDSCSACYYALTNQELVSLRARALIQCKGCFRLLYLAIAMNEATADEPSLPRID